MRVYIKPGISGNALATIAIGEEYLKAWEKYAFPTWKKYCIKHDLGLILVDKDLLDKSEKHWKKATWQKMLIGKAFKENIEHIENVCYIDSDFLINPHSPNIFAFYNPETIGLVSQFENMPYDDMDVKRRIAYFRHYCYDEKYPLDSSLFMSLEQIFGYHNLPVQNNFACAGLIVFNVNNHFELMQGWFEKYERNIDSITGGGDEFHFNYEVQTWGNITWLDYRFQALWTYEMAWKYPFLYNLRNRKDEIIAECIEASLFTNYFLHFAGSWHESEMWKIENIMTGDHLSVHFEPFSAYNEMNLTGNPVGIVKPSKE
jgi:hypothetical protein